MRILREPRGKARHCSLRRDKGVIVIDEESKGLKCVCGSSAYNGVYALLIKLITVYAQYGISAVVRTLAKILLKQIRVN